MTLLRLVLCHDTGRSRRLFFGAIVTLPLLALTGGPASAEAKNSALDVFGEIVCPARDVTDVYKMVVSHLPRAVISGASVAVDGVTVFDGTRISIVCFSGSNNSDKYLLDSFSANGVSEAYSFAVWRRSISEAIEYNRYYEFENADGWTQETHFFVIDSDTTAVSRHAEDN